MTCDASQFDRLLAATLTEAEQQALEQHLETCTDCCQQLQVLTAETTLWTEAEQSLADDVYDTELQRHDRPAADAESGPPEAVVRQIVNLLRPTDDPQMLGRFGGYEIAGLIGTGGMGVVLKGFDKPLNRYVAIKLLAPHLATNGAARGRFAREAQAAAAVVHENVIAIHGVDEDNGLPYLVMPYMRGSSLQKRLDQHGPLSVNEVLRIGRQTAAGLAAAHAQGLIHRDIKPANVLLADGVERVTLTDFGLARAADDASLTHSGFVAGTPQYMSPEQARGEAVDQRSDLFSLGSLLYAMCTGRPPFRADSTLAVLRRIAESHPRPIPELNPTIPIWLCALIEKLQAKPIDERFQSAAEVADLLSQCLAHLQQPGSVPLPESLVELKSTSKRKPIWQRHRWWWIGIALALVALLGWGAWHNGQTSNPGNSNPGNSNPGNSNPGKQPRPATEEVARPVAPKKVIDATSTSGWDDGVAEELMDLDRLLDELEDSDERLDSFSRGDATPTNQTNAP